MPHGFLQAFPDGMVAVRIERRTGAQGRLSWTIGLRQNQGKGASYIWSPGDHFAGGMLAAVVLYNEVLTEGVALELPAASINWHGLLRTVRAASG